MQITDWASMQKAASILSQGLALYENARELQRDAETETGYGPYDPYIQGYWIKANRAWRQWHQWAWENGELLMHLAEMWNRGYQLQVEALGKVGVKPVRTIQ